MLLVSIFRLLSYLCCHSLKRRNTQHTTMRPLLIIAFSFITLTCLQSCSEEFVVSAPYRNITVVAGLLDPQDTFHYIRIQKAFMDENNSAITMSKEPDSSFYDNITVVLYEYNTQQSQVLDTFHLYRVNANDEGFQKKEAINDQQFFTDPNYAYKFRKTDLNPQLWYRLLITNNNTGRTDSSDFIGMVNADTVREGGGFYIPDFRFTDYKLKFAGTGINNRFSVFAYMPRNARLVEGYIRFNYVEKNTALGTTSRHSVEYPFDDEAGITEEGGSFRLSVLNSSIYTFLSTAIDPAPANVERYLDSADVIIYAAGPEVYYYNLINEGQSSGLTGDNIQPTYSNFTSSDVLGVVSSRTKRMYLEADIDKVTIDSLIKHPLIQPLRIRGISED